MKQQGFTVVEVLTIVVIVGILAGIVATGYGAWQRNLTEDVLESDLRNVHTAMKTESQFNNTYPSSVPDNFSPSNNVTMTVVSSTVSTFCIEATRHNSVVDLTWHITEAGTPASGTC